MLGVPILFERNPRTGRLIDSRVPLAGSMIDWVPMERIPGAPIRVTVRSGECVRLEVVRYPDAEQRKVGILAPWYQDADPFGANRWLHEAVDNTDLESVPDGEWEGEAVGPNINRNPLKLEEHTATLSSLFPWRNSLPGIPIPPDLGRVPLDFNDLSDWFIDQESQYSPGAPLDGIVWWWHETPVAMIRSRDFLKGA